MKDLMNIALEACKRGQSEILKVQNNDLSIEWKEDATPVTIADQNAEEAMREFFQKETPDFGIIGEEFATADSDSEYNWIIDPIDGTKSFIAGVPLYGTLLGLYKGNDPVLGIINLPALGQCLSAQSGSGLFLNGSLIKPSVEQLPLEKSIVLSGTINTIEEMGKGPAFKKLRDAAWLYRGWGDCYGYFLVALGRAQLMYDPVVSVWDIAPMEVLMKEGGGAFSFSDGNVLNLFDDTGKLSFKSDQFDSLATNMLNHEEILRYF
ncbi:MAG: histidinol-phosphatase [Fibrobacterales bacterium]